MDHCRWLSVWVRSARFVSLRRPPVANLDWTNQDRVNLDWTSLESTWTTSAWTGPSQTKRSWNFNGLVRIIITVPITRNRRAVQAKAHLKEHGTGGHIADAYRPRTHAVMVYVEGRRLKRRIFVGRLSQRHSAVRLWKASSQVSSFWSNNARGAIGKFSRSQRFT